MNGDVSIFLSKELALKNRNVPFSSSGRSFVAIMLVIALTSLILRTVIVRIMRINISQNESNAQATLKLVSAAMENYAKDHQGVFPTDLSVLTQANPAYLDKAYINAYPVRGYNYNCGRLEASGYNCQAIPVKCRQTGEKIYSITTGGLLVPEDCAQKE